MRRILSLTLALFLLFSFSGCEKKMTDEQRTRNLIASDQELKEAVQRSSENLDRAKRDIQNYKDAYAKAGGR